jgi:hypothetical protein
MRNSMDKLSFSAVLSRYGDARKWMKSPISRQSRYALDCLNFLVASVQIGLGTFVAFYLASLGWSKELQRGSNRARLRFSGSDFTASCVGAF